MSEPSAPLPTQQNPGNKAAKHRLNVCKLVWRDHPFHTSSPSRIGNLAFRYICGPRLRRSGTFGEQVTTKGLKNCITTTTTTTTSGAALFPRGTFCHFYASILERVDRRLGRSSRRRRRCCCHGNAYQTHVFWDAFSRFSQTHTHTNTRSNMVEKSR